MLQYQTHVESTKQTEVLILGLNACIIFDNSRTGLRAASRSLPEHQAWLFLVTPALSTPQVYLAFMPICPSPVLSSPRSTTPSTRPRSANRRPSSSQTNTSALHSPTPKHRCVPVIAIQVSQTSWCMRKAALGGVRDPGKEFLVVP